jgi:hypothetical protein
LDFDWQGWSHGNIVPINVYYQWKSFEQYGRKH